MKNLSNDVSEIVDVLWHLSLPAEKIFDKPKIMKDQTICWQLDKEEIEEIQKNKCIWIVIKDNQPLLLLTKKPEDEKTQTKETS